MNTQPESRRTVEQETLVQHVRALERQAKILFKDFDSHRDIERHSMIMARVFVKIGCMLAVNAIMREDIL